MILVFRALYCKRQYYEIIAFIANFNFSYRYNDGKVFNMLKFHEVSRRNVYKANWHVFVCQFILSTEPSQLLWQVSVYQSITHEACIDNPIKNYRCCTGGLLSIMGDNYSCMFPICST